MESHEFFVSNVRTRFQRGLRHVEPCGEVLPDILSRPDDDLTLRPLIDRRGELQRDLRPGLPEELQALAAVEGEEGRPTPVLPFVDRAFAVCALAHGFTFLPPRD